MTNGSLMKVKSIAECLVFLRGRFTQFLHVLSGYVLFVIKVSDLHLSISVFVCRQ